MNCLAPTRPGSRLACAATLALASILGPGCAQRVLHGQLTVEGGRNPARFAEARALATRAQDASDPDRAIDLYRQALAAYPDLPAAWNNLGVLFLEQGRYLEAAETFVQASERSPTDPRPFYNLGLAWEEAGYLRDALQHYERALARDPRYLPALRGAIRAERMLGQAREITLDWIRTALGIEPNEKWRIWLTIQKQAVEQQVNPHSIGAASPAPATEERPAEESSGSAPNPPP